MRFVKQYPDCEGSVTALDKAKDAEINKI